jgi:hypothetical protein
MKFNLTPSPEDGTERIKTKFLFFPKMIGLEIRWLEKATFKSVYCSPKRSLENAYWRDLEWISK